MSHLLLARGAGAYEVFATWSPGSNRANNAPYSVLDGTTTLATVPVNQQNAPAGAITPDGQVWISLGTYTISSGTLNVRLSDDADGDVIANGVRVVPVPFSNSADIGNPGLAGSASVANGLFTVQGGGSDIWGTSDQFHFAYQSVRGDATIVARVASIDNTNEWAKAGIMFRDSTAADAPFVIVAQRPDGQVVMQWRQSEGESAYWSLQFFGGTAPEFLKLVRSGDTFTGYCSADGLNWTLLGQTTAEISTTADAGLAVTSHDDSQLCTATFDGVALLGTASSPSIAVVGNGVVVPDGESSPRAVDTTDFGTIDPGSTAVETFTITNPATQDVHLTGSQFPPCQ